MNNITSHSANHSDNNLASLPEAFATATLPLRGAYFVTGTDTEIGKTTTTANLIKRLAEQSQCCYAIKPVTAGLAQDNNGHYYSHDATTINRFSNVDVPLSALAPIRLTTPSSPHIAAQIDNVTLTMAPILQLVEQTLKQYTADTVLIEGAGGWFTPINATETLADVAVALQLPVIVVIGVKLGGINHALLTLQAIWQAGLQVDLVVFNEVHAQTDFFHEQVSWLSQAITQRAANYQMMPPMLLTQRYLLS